MLHENLVEVFNAFLKLEPLLEEKIFLLFDLSYYYLNGLIEDFFYIV